ncbi:DgyrCDS12307 [Dimorphilus gyrociliatus]|uniref:DgyrCDS12307 n=1 Tax=Dimorphilus gyrociliatus TaxID=2664684 RepID=A0A7I8W6W7_9ANNE|nr:DgyrCDS12307 [Dimorphilus gyrociliatus]
MQSISFPLHRLLGLFYVIEFLHGFTWNVYVLINKQKNTDLVLRCKDEKEIMRHFDSICDYLNCNLVAVRYAKGFCFRTTNTERTKEINEGTRFRLTLSTKSKSIPLDLRKKLYKRIKAFIKDSVKNSVPLVVLIRRGSYQLPILFRHIRRDLRHKYFINCPPGFVQSNFNCVPCKVGEHSINGITCVECLSGEYQPLKGSAICLKCTRETYSSIKGQKYCKPCEPGYYQDHVQEMECKLCPINQTSVKGFEGNKDCANACPVGGEKSGLTCSACPPGKYKSESGTGKCQDCPKGTYSHRFASVECRKCTGRHFQNIVGQTSCLNCPIGTTSSGDGTACLMTPSLIRRRSDSPIFLFKITFRLRVRKGYTCLNKISSFDIFESKVLSQACHYGKPPKECFVLLYHNCKKGWFNGYLDIAPDDNLIPAAHACRRSEGCTVKFYSRYLNNVYKKQIRPVLLERFEHVLKSVRNNYLWLCPGGFQAKFDVELGRCFPCPKGHFKRGNGTSHCQKCPVGFFAPMNGMDKCKKCPSKSYTKRTGSVSVQECKPSTIIKQVGLKGSQFGKWSPRSANGSTGINFFMPILIGLVGLFLVFLAAFTLRKKRIWLFKRKQKSKQSKVTNNVDENLKNVLEARETENKKHKDDNGGREKEEAEGENKGYDKTFGSFVQTITNGERSHTMTTNKTADKEDVQMDKVKHSSTTTEVVKTEVEGEFEDALVNSNEKSTLKFNRPEKVSVESVKMTDSDEISIINSEFSKEAILNIIDPGDEKDKLMDESNKERSNSVVQTSRLGKGDVIKSRYISTTIPFNIKEKINELFSWESQNTFKNNSKIINDQFRTNSLNKEENFIINSCCCRTSNFCEPCSNCSYVGKCNSLQSGQMVEPKKTIPQTMYLCKEEPLKFDCDEDIPLLMKLTNY